MSNTLVYESIRKEILDQKNCQFQMLTATVTLTAAVIGLAARSEQASIAYIGPAIMSALALFIIFDKAVSIQRKVGYLQLIESHPETTAWSWESDLDRLRGEKLAHPEGEDESSRKHSWARNVSGIFLLLIVICFGLYLLAHASATNRGADAGAVDESWIVVIASFVVTLCAAIATRQRYLRRLSRGDASSAAITKGWNDIYGKNSRSTPMPPGD